MSYNYGTSAKSELEEFTTLFSGLFERQDLLIRQQAVRINTLETEIASLSDLRTLVTGHTTQIANNQSQITNNQSQITNNQSQISSLNTSTTTRLDNLDSGLSSTNDIISALDVKVETNKSAIQTLTTSTTTSITAINTTLQSNSTNLTQQNNKITALQSSTGANTASIVSLTTKSNQNATNITTLITNITGLNTISGNHSTLIAGLRTDVDSIGGSQADITNLQNDVSTINSTLTAHDVRISYNLEVFTGFLQSSQSLVVRLNAVEADISTINTTITAHDGRITSNTTLINDLLMASQFTSGLISVIDGKIITLRTDTDANTLLGSQLLTALQYQSTTIFTIDTAIQISNGKVAILETTQITQDNLIREFDQLFNEPDNGVVDKLNNIISTYNTHISGVYLTLRQNVDGNNLILGTLSTQTTSLLTAMTQIYSRVQVLEDNAQSSSSPSNFDLFDEYPSTNYVEGGVIQTSSNITVEEALEIGLTISNLYAIVHNVGGITYYCGAGGRLVSGQSSNRTTFVKK
jgi:hypothetical protein